MFEALFQGPQHATTTWDISYGPNPQHKLDLYQPARPNGKLVFMVHGGGWRNGDKRNAGVVENKKNFFLSKGYTFVSINYRLPTDSVDVTPYEMAQDVALALAFCQSKARRWKVNTRSFVLMGHSAGAHLVALINTAEELYTGLAPWACSVLLDSAAYDVIAIMDGPHFPLYDQAFGTDQDLWLQCSPRQRMSKRPQPMLLVYSSERGENDVDNVVAFQATARTFCARTPSLPEALSHGEIDDQLGLPSKYTRDVYEFIQTYA